MNCQATRPDLAPRPGLPCDCLSTQIGGINLEVEVFDISLDDGEVSRLIAAVKTQPQAKAVR